MIKCLYKKLIPKKTRIELIYLKNRFKAWFLKGDKYYCNCCNKSFRKFLPKGNVLRDNAMCPNCMSLERTRVLMEYLKNETGVFTKRLKVLHFAPERCLFDQLIKQNIEYVDGDLNPLFARNIIDITNIPYPDNYFDLIICSHVLGHVPDEKKALHELKRVIASNGFAIIMSLIDFNRVNTYENSEIITEAEKLEHYGEPDLERLYGRDFSNRLEEAGFRVEIIDYRNKLNLSLKERLNTGDGSREVIFKCTK